MGSSAAPKVFPSSPRFGASAQPQVVTPTQPLALNSGTQTPAASGFQMNPAITSPMAQTGSDATGSPQDLLAQARANRGGGGRQPFYGQMY
jgi:hypothetical protein